MTIFKALLRSGVAAVVVAGLCCSLVLAASASAEPFGLKSFEMSVTNQPTPEQQAKGEPGSPDLQAGSHPYAFTTTFVMNEGEAVDGQVVLADGLKDAQAALPPGFVGNPTTVPTCSYHDFVNLVCPNDTAVGVSTIGLGAETRENAKHQLYLDTVTVSDPLYNLAPPGGVASEVGSMVAGSDPVQLESSVRTGGDYGITTASRNITESIVITSVRIKVWGVPADPSHDRVRGKCLVEDPTNKEEPPHNEEDSNGECPAGIPVRPFLTNPVSCGEPREATLSVDGWNHPGNFATGEHVISKTATLPPLSGCERLGFSPSITAQPDGNAGSTPTGLNVDVHVPQESTSNPVGLGEADIKTTTVVLPAGTSISPSAADGLQACSGNPADQPGTPGNEIGFEGSKEYNPVSEPGARTLTFSSKLPEQLQPGVNFCPDASKIANVRIKTPLLEGEVTGSVYLASPQNFTFAGAPQENPFSSLLAVYLVASEPATGVLVKLPGRITLCESQGEIVDGQSCEAAGQIVATFEHTPQLPYSDAKLEFYGTDRAPLATPALCGSYITASSLEPWSHQGALGETGTPDASPPSSFNITSGPVLETTSGLQQTACADPLPFSPTLHSSVSDINAGSFSPLTTTLSREDGQQQIQQVTLHYPPGLSGILSGIPLCPEAQANTGTCPAESQIGETIVSVGLGNDPFSVTGGKVYLTGPYEGAPFGLSIDNPAKAGPFDLQEGRPVVVRATINVDPHTAALTVTTNTAAQGHAIPSMIEGIPLQIKHVNVNIVGVGGNNKFTFNPTSCDPAQITGTVVSAEGASSPVQIPFQVTNCAQLKFAPQFSVSTSGKTSKAGGASLTAKVTYPYGPQGTYADVASVKVELPKQLPSRLTTLQKACTAAQFNTNPAGCPAPSVIGHAVVHTPLLPVPLEGPAYFVSNGGEAFPNLIMVLQGYGVKIDLVGDTFISKAGITSTTFKTVPDQPFSSFELTLGEGPYSALAANGNLCALTTIKTIKKKVTVKARGRRKTVTRKIKETEPATLQMPNEFVGQNGATVKQTTTIAVTGCVKAAAPAKKKTKKAKAKRRKK